MSEQSTSIAQLIPLASITIAANVRTKTGLDAASIKELSESLKTNGLMQPIYVARVDGGYAVIAGQRRTLAAIAAGWTEISAIVTDSTESAELKGKQIVENLHRENLGLSETCEGVRELLAMVGKPAEVQKRLNKSAGWVSKHLSITGPNFTPEVRDLVTQGQCNDIETALSLHQIAKIAPTATTAGLIAQVRNGLVGRAKVRAELERLKAGDDDQGGEEGGEGEGEGGGSDAPTAKQTVTFDLSAEAHAVFEAMGGIAWLKRQIKKAADAQQTLPV